MFSFVLCWKLASVYFSLLLCFSPNIKNWLFEKLERRVSEPCPHYWGGTRMSFLQYSFIGIYSSYQLQ
ncbi:hypothetical protein PVAP13_2KG026132 [Panicum virgatum]|uniref:Uncharacterized protein n=1 Tax=Panicum virgatum TaxID=38727 RepID=A0A8T0VXC3_PANVG|nr:hypothetical protein PVAP13_2KG026132 [Panicum virgatum]